MKSDLKKNGGELLSIENLMKSNVSSKLNLQGYLQSQPKCNDPYGRQAVEAYSYNTMS